jgi:hypothetical protein
MVQLLTEMRTEAAHSSALQADYLERDREAWNVPRAPVEAVPAGVDRDGLDWDRFRDLYYPDSRRHDFEAIVSYGAHRRSRHTGSSADEATHLNGDAGSTEALP